MKLYLLLILGIIFFSAISIAQESSAFSHKVYIAPYVGDIDGNVSEEWFFFYDMLADFHSANKIPGGFSFYPATINNDPDFMEPFLKMYLDPNIELIQKGNDGDDLEAVMATLPLDVQKDTIQKGQNTFKQRLSERLGIDEIFLPQSYNQIQGSFSNDTQQVAESLGFKQYFDVFMPASNITLPQTNDDFISIQYGISYSKQGNIPGKTSVFKSTDTILEEIENYERADINITRIDGIPVIPLWTHQQDFESSDSEELLSRSKWKIYTDTLKKLKEDPNVELILPSQIHEMLLEDKDEPNYCFAPISESRKLTSPYGNNLCNSLQFSYGGISLDLTKYCYLIINSVNDVPQENNLTISFNYDHYLYNASLQFSEKDICINNAWAENSFLKKKERLEYNLTNSSLNAITPYDLAINKISFDLCSNSTIDIPGPILCNGETPLMSSPGNVEVCTWKGCKRGAVSITVDDYFTSCMDELDEHGYKGTYYLSNTDEYTEETWKKFNDAFHNGHEIGTHTQSHTCVQTSLRNYRKDVQKNINDIVENTDINQTDLVSHAYPCGFSTPRIREMLSTEWNYLSARGYNVNNLESSTPNDFFYLNSLNGVGYPGGALDPPDYFESVDKAQREKKWMNLVFHSYCSDDGVIDYLPKKNIWVDTVGNIVRYIEVRNQAAITDYGLDSKGISFRVNSAANSSIYSQNLSLRVGVGNNLVKEIKVNGKNVQFNWDRDFTGYHVIFDVPFPIDDEVEVLFE